MTYTELSPDELTALTIAAGVILLLILAIIIMKDL
jgi:hypothetical protein